MEGLEGGGEGCVLVGGEGVGDGFGGRGGVYGEDVVVGLNYFCFGFWS